MTPTPEQIAEVRRTWPAWDDATIRRHLEQRAELSRIAQEQQRRRMAESLSQVYEVRH